MKTLTLPQASMLYGNGYQLWDRQRNVWNISSVSTGFSFIKKEPDDYHMMIIRQNEKGAITQDILNYDEIGTDYKIIVRKNDAITKPLEDGTIPIVECAKIADLDFTMEGLKFRSKDKVHGCYYIDRMHLGAVFNYSEYNRCFALYQQEPKIIHIVPFQDDLFSYMKSKHFQLDLPDELCVSMEEINIKK